MIVCQGKMFGNANILNYTFSYIKEKQRTSSSYKNLSNRSKSGIKNDDNHYRVLCFD